MDSKKNLYYTYRGQTITVGDFLKDKSTVFYNEREPVTIQEFLSFKFDIDLLSNLKAQTNSESIKSLYTTNDEKLTMGDGISLKIKTNTQLCIPKTRASKSNQFPQKKPEKSPFRDLFFKSKVLSDLQKDKGYKLVHTQTKNTLGNSLVKKIPRISVWIWSRVLGQDNPDSGWFDLTPFVSVLTTNNTTNGGNFSFTLPPISCEHRDGRWVLKKEHIKFYNNSSVNGTNYISQVNFFTEKERVNKSDVLGLVVENVKHRERTKFLFQSIISPNDLVFIKFDMLELESSYRENTGLKTINSQDLRGKVYDMIGLVDKSSITSSILNSVSVDINISGRDLVKPLIEDGVYFFPTEYSNKAFGGLRYSGGEVVELSPFLFKNIEDIMKLFVEKLSNITVVPNDVLKSYPGDRGIWKLIKLSVDKAVLKRTVVDSSLSIAQGSLITHFRKICQEPLVEFYTDTYFDQFHLIVRVPPFTQKHLKQLLSGTFVDENGSTTYLDSPYTIIDESTILSETLTFQDDDIYTWFHLTPKEIVGGLSQDNWLIAFPPVIFPELVEIYGSKPLQLTHNYLSYTLDLENENPKLTKTIKEQSLEDLKFLIETQVHLPFTRKGTITVIGNRTLKRGEYVYYAPTNELFYIDAVSHSYSGSNKIQNTTTIQVSRGMVVDYILGKDEISYFNLVNLKNIEVYSEVDDKRLESEEIVVTKKRKVLVQKSFGHKIDLSGISFPKKSTVNLSTMNWRLLSYLHNLPEPYRTMVYITSGTDGRHMDDSQHSTGDAIDLRLGEPGKHSPSQSHKDSLYRYIKNDPQREAYGIEPPPHPNHGTAPHIHLEVYRAFLNSKEKGVKFDESYDYQDETYTEKETRTKEVNTGKKIRVLDTTKTLGNIKINKNTLNFFLKRQQFR